MPTLMTNMQPLSVMKSSLVSVSTANFTTWDMTVTSDGKEDTGISRKMSPVSGSTKKREISLTKFQMLKYLPSMMTTTKPFILFVEIMIGSSLTGSRTQQPENVPAATSLGSFQNRMDPKLWIVNIPSSVNEKCGK